MAKNHKASIAKLEKKLSSLRKSFDGMNEDASLEELLRVIHRPGWTTPAELIFVHGIVDSIASHMDAVKNLKVALLNGSNQVGL